MNFLFDIGRVLLDFDFERSLATLLPEGVAEPRQRMERLLARKDEFESGAIETDAYVDWALETLESEASHEEFRHAWCNIFTPNEPMWSQVRELEADGHKLVLFSNTNAMHMASIRENFPEFSLFHGAVLSFEVGSVKPRPDIYRHAIEEHGMEPAKTLYIDDLPENVEAGRAAGFTCWQYELNNHTAFEQWLDKMLSQKSIISP